MKKGEFIANKYYFYWYEISKYPFNNKTSIKYSNWMSLKYTAE